MSKKIDRLMEKLADARLPEIREKFEEVLGESTRAPNKKYLLRRIREGLEAKELEAKAARKKTKDSKTKPSKPKRESDGLTKLTVEELQQRYLEEVGRETGSGDKGYLIWKIRMARKGKVRVGPARERKYEPGTTQVVPLTLPREAVAAVDEVVGSTNFANRSAFLKRAIQVRSGGDGWDEYVTTVKLHVRALDAADAQVQVLGLIEGGVHEDGSPNAVEAYSIVYAPARRTTAENADTPGVSPDPDAWEIYDEPGAVDAASRLEAALARAASEARRLYGEPEQDLAVAAVRGYRAFLGPALRAEVDFGATDGEALHAAITRLADALAPTSEAMRAAITDALYDTVG